MDWDVAFGRPAVQRQQERPRRDNHAPGRRTHTPARPALHGEERGTLWCDAILAQAPEVSRYAQKAGRTIPVAVLEPV